MREIKFRARVENEDGIFEIKRVSKLTMFSRGGLYYVYCENDDYEYQLTPSDLMQFTGLKDKNSKDIYEGDILARENFDHWVITYHKAGFHLYNAKNHNTLYALEQAWDREVIGNIYENPELLK